MYKILILPCIGVVFILLLRSNKEKETIPVFRYEEETNINGDSTNYLPFSRTPEDKQCETSKIFDTY
jgi:hypothetical protein